MRNETLTIRSGLWPRSYLKNLKINWLQAVFLNRSNPNSQLGTQASKHRYLFQRVCLRPLFHNRQSLRKPRSMAEPDLVPLHPSSNLM